MDRMGVRKDDPTVCIDTTDEPTTGQIDALSHIRNTLPANPSAIAGIGGGTVMDVARAWPC